VSRSRGRALRASTTPDRPTHPRRWPRDSITGCDRPPIRAAAHYAPSWRRGGLSELTSRQRTSAAPRQPRDLVLFEPTAAPVQRRHDPGDAALTRGQQPACPPPRPMPVHRELSAAAKRARHRRPSHASIIIASSSGPAKEDTRTTRHDAQVCGFLNQRPHRASSYIASRMLSNGMTLVAPSGDPWYALQCLTPISGALVLRHVLLRRVASACGTSTDSKWGFFLVRHCSRFATELGALIA
jgi:hypothetical protein